MNWDEYFVNMLDVVSLKSKDTTKTSSIIVGPAYEIRSTGYNGAPRGFNDNDKIKFEKPEKYFWVEHAERNAIYNAARVGTSTDNCTLYASHFPCIDCARAIVQAGITKVVISNKNLDAFTHKSSMYYEHKQRTIEMFRQCKISLIIHEEDNIDVSNEKEDLDKLWGV